MAEHTRDDFRAEVKRNLAARVGHVCSNPGCRAATSGPQLDDEKAVNVGVAAHITAASEGGPRFHKDLTPSDRIAAENGIWLCQNCAKLIDSDVARFTTLLIRAWKDDAEASALRNVGRASNGSSPRSFSEHTYLALLASDNDISVPAHFSQTVPPPGLRARTIAPDVSRKFEVAELLEDAKGVIPVLLGPGGAGKSTALRALARAAAQLRINDMCRPIPVLLELRHLRDGLRELVARRLSVREADLDASFPGLLLLIDGLNEISPMRRVSLLDELESFSTTVGAQFVLCTRASFADHPVELRHRAIFYQVLPWSWRDVRAYAERLVGTNRVEAFLAYFSRLLRATTPRDAGLPIVPVLAVQTFSRSKENQTSVYDLALDWSHACADRFDAQKATLGAPLDGLPRETVLRLASCLAYQLHVEQGLRAATVDELPALMQAALAELRQLAAIGASSLDDNTAVLALTQAGLVTRRRDRSLEFEHEMLGDFLASQRIAPVSARLASLPADLELARVWEFVSRQLDEERRRGMVTRALSSSIVLAARCASRHTPEFDSIANAALERIRRGTPIQRTIAVEALASLEVLPCVDALRLASRTDPDPHRRWAASLLLSRAGDLDHLALTLREAEKMASGPGDAGGGEIALWWYGPPDILLAVARENIREGNELVCLSLETLARYGGDNDTDLVFGVVCQSAHLKSLLTCFEVLSELRPQLIPDAAAVARERVGDSDGRIHLENHLAHYGACDFSWLLDVASAPTGQDWHDSLVAGDALAELELSKRQRWQALRRFAEIRATHASKAWRLARCCRLRLPFRAVVDALATNSEDELVYVSAYLCAGHGHFCDREATEILHRAMPRLTIGGAAHRNLVEFLAKSGCVEDAAIRVQQEIARLASLVADLRALRTGEMEDGSSARERELRYEIETGLARWLHPALTCQDLIPAKLFVTFLHKGSFEGAGHGCMERCVAILKTLSSDEVDAELLFIRKPEDRAWALAELAALGATAVRVRILCEILLQIEEHPSCVDPCWHASKHMWSPELAAAWIKCVNTRYHHRRDLAEWIPGRIEQRLYSELTNDDVAVIDSEIECCASHAARVSLENLREAIIFRSKRS